MYLVNRWVVLPAIDPMMRLAPEGWFLVSHPLFRAVAGLGIALLARRDGVLSA